MSKTRKWVGGYITANGDIVTNIEHFEVLKVSDKDKPTENEILEALRKSNYTLECLKDCHGLTSIIDLIEDNKELIKRATT